MLYEGGTRVVGLANWPGHIPAGSVVDQPIHVVDMFPTLGGLAGADLGRGKPLDGLDVWATLAQGRPSPRTEVVYDIEPFRAAIRQGDWKLVDWRDHDAKQNSGWQLYDLRQDPGERNDLAAREPERVAALRRAWAEWDAQNIPPRWHGGVVEDPTAPAPRPKAKK